MWNRGLRVGVGLVLGMVLAPGVADASPIANWAMGVPAGLPSNAGSSPGVSIPSISCPSAGNCTAVGLYVDNSLPSGLQQGLLLSESAGTWATGLEASVPTGGLSSSLDTVSCPSAGNCTAAGTYQPTMGHYLGLLVTETSGAWGAGVAAPVPSNARSTPDALIRSLSCPSAGNCSAVGTYYDTTPGLQGLLLTEKAGTWSASEAILPNGATNPQVELESLSCASAGNCTAVGSYWDSSGHPQGILLNETSGSWQPGLEATLPAGFAANPNADLSSVSCASAGNCSAVGGYEDSSGLFQGLLLTETSGTWAPGVETTPPTGAATNPSVFIGTVSCASPGNCSAAGSYRDSSGSDQGLLVNESSGTWAPAIEAPLPTNAAPTQPAQTRVSSVSCASVGSCDAVGTFRDGAGEIQGFTLTESSGTWQPGAEAAFPDQSTNQSASLGAVSCSSTAACGAVGGYFDSSSNEQGALFNTAPATPALSVTAPATADGGSAIAPASLSAALASGMSPVGTITFRVFGPQSSPPTSCTSGGTTLGSATVAGNATYHPPTGFTPPGAGDYWWYASYGGDASDNPVRSACGPMMARTVVAGPVLTGFRQSHKRWREPRKSAGRKKHKPPIGTTFTFNLTEPATVTLSFGRHAPGRVQKHRCVAPTKRNRQRRACTRTIPGGTLKLAAKAGRAKIVFRGKTSSHHRLVPGIYTVTITAKNANGRSAPKALIFTIVS